MGPLKDIKIVEFGGIGPGPMGAMLLAERGATVLRIERKEPADLGLKRPRQFDLLLRSRPAIRIDLKAPDAWRWPCAWPGRPTRSSKDSARA